MIPKTFIFGQLNNFRSERVRLHFLAYDLSRLTKNLFWGCTAGTEGYDLTNFTLKYPTHTDGQTFSYTSFSLLHADSLLLFEERQVK